MANKQEQDTFTCEQCKKELPYEQLAQSVLKTDGKFVVTIHQCITCKYQRQKQNGELGLL